MVPSPSQVTGAGKIAKSDLKLALLALSRPQCRQSEVRTAVVAVR
jgi:hypothetical protein